MAVGDDDEGTDEDELAGEESEELEVFEARRQVPASVELGMGPGNGKYAGARGIRSDDMDDDVDDDF